MRPRLASCPANIVVLFFSWLSINFLHVLLLVYVWNLCSYVMISKQKCCFHLNSCTVKSCFKHSQFIFMENFEAPPPQFHPWKILVISTQFGTRSMHIHTSNTSLPYLFCLDLLLKLIGACLIVHKSRSWLYISKPVYFYFLFYFIYLFIIIFIFW